MSQNIQMFIVSRCPTAEKDFVHCGDFHWENNRRELFLCKDCTADLKKQIDEADK